MIHQGIYQSHRAKHANTYGQKRTHITKWTGQGTLQKIPGAKDKKRRDMQNDPSKTSSRAIISESIWQRHEKKGHTSENARSIQQDNHVKRCWKHMQRNACRPHRESFGHPGRHHALDTRQENASGPSAKASSQARRFKKNESRPSANRQRYLAGDNWEGNSPEDKCKEMKVDRLLNDPARASSIKHKSNHRQLLAKPLIFFSPTNTWKDADPKSTSVQTSISNVQRETFMV